MFIIIRYTNKLKLHFKYNFEIIDIKKYLILYHI